MIMYKYDEADVTFINSYGYTIKLKNKLWLDYDPVSKQFFIETTSPKSTVYKVTRLK